MSGKSAAVAKSRGDGHGTENATSSSTGIVLAARFSDNPKTIESVWVGFLIIFISIMILSGPKHALSVHPA